MSYDSRFETLAHSQRVGELMIQLGKALLDRSTCHDRSKTLPPEVEVFNEFTPKLKTSTYGSEEYKGYLEAMGEGLAHHYAHNRHHPEHFADGVNGMTLVDLVEMLADWKAATERHDDGSLKRSLEIQRERFGIGDQLDAILRNTALYYGWLDGIQRGRWYPEMPPALPDENGDQYTDRLTGADRTNRRPYDHRRNRQCSIGWHEECSDPDGEVCKCPCHDAPSSPSTSEEPA